MKSIVLKLNLLFLSLLVVVAPALAAPPTSKEVLILPVRIVGDYRAVSGDDFTQTLIKEAQRLAPKARLIVPREADLRGLGGPTGAQPPSARDCAKLCGAYKTTHVVWLELRFRPEIAPAEEGQPAILTLSGGGRFYAYRNSDGRVVVDQPLSVARSTTLPGGSGPDQTQVIVDKESQLSAKIVNLLVQQLITVAKQQESQNMVNQWKKAPTASSTVAVSPQYKAMADSVQQYSKAVKAGDLIKTTDTQQVALSCWNSLNPQERAGIEQEYPGTTQWMQGGIYYELGGYYPRGGYYRR